MVCYAVPTIAALVHKKVYGKSPNWQKYRSLNLLLWGGSIFGIVDHLWNGELFLVSNIVSDLALGAAITVAIFAGWGILTAVEKTMKQSVKTRT